MKLQDSMKKDNVIVFPRNALKPWDSMPSIDFIKADLESIKKNQAKPQREKVIMKSTFVGQINQVKTKIAVGKAVETSKF